MENLKTEVRKPLLNGIIDNITVELDELSENINAVTNRLCIIDDFRNEPNVPFNSDPVPQTKIQELTEKLNCLRELNRRVVVIKEGLFAIVG